MTLHPSLKPDPNRKGSYYRRIEDIDRALIRLLSPKPSAVLEFTVYYPACEKLAWNMIGVSEEWPAPEIDKKKNGPPLSEIQTAVRNLGLEISDRDLESIFMGSNALEKRWEADPDALSARVLRNRFFHDLGPMKLDKIEKHAPVLIPRMVAFLKLAPKVLAHLKKKYSHLP